MKYYIDGDSNVYAYEDDVENIRPGLTPITEEEAINIANPPPTKEEHIEFARLEKAQRQAQAQIAIAPLQNAIDIDDATDEEIALLKRWKQHSVAVNRVDINTAPDTTWPTPPAS